MTVAVKVVLLVALGVIAYRLGAGKIEAGEAWPIAAIALIAAVVLLVPNDRRSWSNFFGSLSKAGLGPVSFEFRSEVERAANSADEIPKDDAEATNAIALRLKLESRLAYVAKHLMREEEDGATFVTIGSLRYDGLISDQEAWIAARVMALRQEELTALSSSEQDRFLTAANQVVDSLRASVLRGLAVKHLEGLGWTWTPIPRKPRDDLLAEKGDYRVRIATLLADAQNSELLGRTTLRLRPDKTRVPAVERRLIIVPNGSASRLLDRPQDDPRVIRLCELADALPA